MSVFPKTIPLRRIYILEVGIIPQRLNPCQQCSVSQSAHWEQWETKRIASCLSVSSWQTSIEIHVYPHTNAPSAKCSSVCSRMYVCVCVCVNSSMMMSLYCPTSVSKCIITGVQESLRLIHEIANPCPTQLDSQPPFQSSLHSQLWGAAHRGSQKHLQSWNGVWDLCSDYTGTSRVHILSHDSLCQNNSSPLYGCNTVVHDSVENNQKPNLRSRDVLHFSEDAQKVYSDDQFQSCSIIFFPCRLIDLLSIITKRLEVYIKRYWSPLSDSVSTDDNHLSFS